MSRRSVLFLIFISIGNLCLGQSRSEVDEMNNVLRSYTCIDDQKFDSLFTEIDKIGQAKEYYSQLGIAYYYNAYKLTCKGEIRPCVNMLHRALTYFEKDQDREGKAKVFNLLSSSHSTLGQMDSALIYARSNLAMAESLEDSFLMAAAHASFTNAYTGLSKSDSVIYHALTGLRLLETSNRIDLIRNLNIAIGNSYYLNEDFRLSIKYYLKALYAYDQSHPDMGMIYHNLGTCFTGLRSYDSAFYYLDKADTIYQKFNRKLEMAINYQALAENYRATGNCNKSIEYNLLAKKLSGEIGEKRNLAASMSNISMCYLELGQIQKAIENLKLAIKIDQEIGDQDKEADAHFLLSQAFEKAGNYQLALESYHRFYSLDSLLLNRDKQSTIATLETEYETEKKEAAIESLSQQASIQALEIQQKNQMILIGLIAFLLVLIIIVFFFQQRALKRNKSKTELEQRFLRSQLNPHFISNALVSVQNFLFKNDSKSAALYLSKFSKLMREILENSRREFITVEAELEMLRNFLDIHKLRIGNDFEYKINVDDNIEVEIDTIPPMFVQPFVENAIEHGISSTKDGGFIELNFIKDDAYILIEVKDNGEGLYAGKSTDGSHQSLSTKIISERMELFNRSLKNKIQLILDEMKDEEGKVLGTKVELKVPFSYI